ncbi:nitrate reductase molybdenum cofactor assembly chaperone [Corynebacterium uterequi]|uniref:Respiratory nitrate reductase chaperone NarJ n=1 Tax=Corynebacterium uterequi TaxID=1072256 RepID=A0A0G3HIB0_9CORY|nr:nitrate reductase molybdenum cofactor assembly chaperone [Corynebacterium uterequi]AKK10877.1 respiratory nitrate reductase chaperone NarJ [Corynebacterium uterequi]
MRPLGAAVAEVTAPVEVSIEQRRVTAMAAALLLAYPDPEEAPARFEAVSEQLHTLPAAVRAEFEAFFAATHALSARELAAHYVETFDQRRRCCLFLSYYLAGDTRKRGAAILAFRDRLRDLGIVEISEELPDHLCVVLEALALADDAHHEAAVELVAAHREGVEVLKSALDAVGSAYAHVVRAVAMVLPEIDASTVDRYVTLITAGPPAEVVGVEQLGIPLPDPIRTAYPPMLKGDHHV